MMDQDHIVADLAVEVAVDVMVHPAASALTKVHITADHIITDLHEVVHGGHAVHHTETNMVHPMAHRTTTTAQVLALPVAVEDAMDEEDPVVSTFPSSSIT